MKKHNITREINRENELLNPVNDSVNSNTENNNHTNNYNFNITTAEMSTVNTNNILTFNRYKLIKDDTVTNEDYYELCCQYIIKDFMNTYLYSVLNEDKKYNNKEIIDKVSNLINKFNNFIITFRNHYNDYVTKEQLELALIYSLTDNVNSKYQMEYNILNRHTHLSDYNKNKLDKIKNRIKHIDNLMKLIRIQKKDTLSIYKIDVDLVEYGLGSIAKDNSLIKEKVDKLHENVKSISDYLDLDYYLEIVEKVKYISKYVLKDDKVIDLFNLQDSICEIIEFTSSNNKFKEIYLNSSGDVENLINNIINLLK